MKNSRIPDKKKIMRRLAAGLAVLLTLSMSACGALPTPTPGGMNQTQMTIPVVRGNIDATMSFIGNVKYNQSATLTWKTAGVVDKIYVQAGDEVKQGDILAELATDSLDSSVLLAEKTMIEQEENLEDVQESTNAKMQAYVTLSEKEDALKTAKLEQEALYYPRATQQDKELAWDTLSLASMNFNYAKQDYDALVDNNVAWEGEEPATTVSMFGRTMTFGGNSESGRGRKFNEYVESYDTLVSAYEDYVWTSGEPTDTDYAVAEGKVRVAQMEYDEALKEYLSYEQIPRAKDVSAAQASLNTAETNYNKRYIIAQFDGTVTSVSAEEGHYVTKGTTALRIDDKSSIYIPIDIPELDVTSVYNGVQVEITLDAVSGKTYHGTIYTVATATESSTYNTSFSATVLVDDPDDQMFAGMTAEVSMPLSTKENVLLVPSSALSYDDNKVTLTVAGDDGENKTVEVKVGTVSGSISEITSGDINEGDMIVVSSVSTEALEALGLDPADYMTAPMGMPEGAAPSEDGSEQAPEMPAGEASDVSEASSSAEAKEQTSSEKIEAKTEETASEDSESTAEEAPADKPADMPEGMQEPPEGFSGGTPPQGNPPSGGQGGPQGNGGARPDSAN